MERSEPHGVFTQPSACGAMLERMASATARWSRAAPGRVCHSPGRQTLPNVFVTVEEGCDE